jgi:hypothetical protein
VHIFEAIQDVCTVAKGATCGGVSLELARWLSGETFGLAGSLEFH